MSDSATPWTRGTLGFCVLHCLLEFSHVLWVSYAKYFVALSIFEFIPSYKCLSRSVFLTLECASESLGGLVKSLLSVLLEFLLFDRSEVGPENPLYYHNPGYCHSCWSVAPSIESFWKKKKHISNWAQYNLKSVLTEWTKHCESPELQV